MNIQNKNLASLFLENASIFRAKAYFLFYYLFCRMYLAVEENLVPTRIIWFLLLVSVEY